MTRGYFKDQLPVRDPNGEGDLLYGIIWMQDTASMGTALASQFNAQQDEILKMKKTIAVPLKK
jgi:hypothetical protein